MDKKTVILERRARPEEFTVFFLRFFSQDWKRYKKYETVRRAIQAYEGLVKSSSWNHKFDWRLITEVGPISLPVVRA